MSASARSLLVGIDLGTTVCKALVFDQDLRLLSAASRHLSIATLSGTEIEQDAEGWWSATKDVVREALQASKCDARSVRGLSISSQGISFVPVDERGAPLRAAFSWLDTRASEQRREILDTWAEERIFSITGKRCHEVYLLPKLLWFRRNQSSLWEKCRRILMPLDFIIARLTGEYATDHTMASGTMLYDISRQEWSPEILEAFELDGSMLPRLAWGGTPVGRLRAEAAESLGLPRELTVSMGGQDQKVAALGAGIDLRRSTISLGTAMAITQKCETPVIDARMRVPCFTNLLPGSWVLEGSSVCCSILDWAKQTFFQGRGDDELNRMAEQAADRLPAPVLLPFFSGASVPVHDPRARGALCGLDLSTTPGQIVRSIYEGIAFLVRANIEVMESISRPVEELRIFGGGSRSDVWCGIIADVTQRPVIALVNPEAASVGAAMLAGMGSGVFKELHEAFTHITVRTSYEPKLSCASFHAGRYAEFQRLSGRLLEGNS